jgi:hypothetical protein
MSAVLITLGNGAEALITKSGYLVIQKGLKSVNLGKVTRWRIDNIKEHLERLKIHCPE